MNDLGLSIKLMSAIVIDVVISLIGGWDLMLEVMIMLSILDVFTGVVLAIANKELSSKKAYNGMAKKVGIYILIAMSYQAGKYLGYDDLRGIVIGFFIAHEMISIIENWGAFGLPIPKKLKNILQELREE